MTESVLRTEETTPQVTYETRELSSKTWADFERLFEPERQDWAFCACMLYQRGCHLDRQGFPDIESERIQNLAEKRCTGRRRASTRHPRVRRRCAHRVVPIRPGRRTATARI